MKFRYMYYFNFISKDEKRFIQEKLESDKELDIDSLMFITNMLIDTHKGYYLSNLQNVRVVKK